MNAFNAIGEFEDHTVRNPHRRGAAARAVNLMLIAASHLFHLLLLNLVCVLATIFASVCPILSIHFMRGSFKLLVLPRVLHMRLACHNVRQLVLVCVW